MQFRINSGTQEFLLQKDFFNFEYIPLKISGTAVSKIKDASLHLETLKFSTIFLLLIHIRLLNNKFDMMPKLFRYFNDSKYDVTFSLKINLVLLQIDSPINLIYNLLQNDNNFIQLCYHVNVSINPSKITDVQCKVLHNFQAMMNQFYIRSLHFPDM